ncbi:hypothetical protein ACHAWX_003798 [Stephanocyclus meneghinianus]
MSTTNPNHPLGMVGRDELAALLGASQASDMLAAADTKRTALPGVSSSRKQHADDDISRLDRSQAAALVARQFASGASEGVTRHRAAGKRKMEHQLLAGDLMNDRGRERAPEEEDVLEFYEKRDEEDGFAIRKRTKTEAAVLLRQRDGSDRRRRHSSSSESESGESSSSSDESSHSRNRSRRRRGIRSGSRSRSSSSSSDFDDSADRRRRRARERRVKSRDQLDRSRKEEDREELRRRDKQETVEGDGRIDVDLNCQKKQQLASDDEDDTIPPSTKNTDTTQMESNQNRKSPSKSESSDDSSTSSSDEEFSTSSSSSEDSTLDQPLPSTVSKPLFVPKSKRGTIAEIEAQQQKLEDVEKRKLMEKERRTIQSRALVAEAVSMAEKNRAVSSAAVGEAEEFDVGEAGTDFIPIPDDSDPNDDSPELVQAERDAWEVRELLRILREFDKAAEAEREKREIERRRNMTDEERLTEAGYRAPGEARRCQGDKDGKSGMKYLQRYHHRGAFYMDDDTLEKAGENDVRHRAAEYSRAATGEDKIDKSALPEVMQVKKFGFAGYSTKYKGLAKEDTTDKQLDFLPVRHAGRRCDYQHLACAMKMDSEIKQRITTVRSKKNTPVRIGKYWSTERIVFRSVEFRMIQVP